MSSRQCRVRPRERERSIERTLSRRAKVENSLKRNHLEEFKTTQLHQVNPLPTPRPEWVDLINGGNQRVEEREQWNYNNRFGNASGGAEELLPTYSTGCSSEHDELAEVEDKGKDGDGDEAMTTLIWR